MHESELPISGYDGLSGGELAHRVRSLARPDLETVLRHERTHAHRPAVERLIEARLAQLSEGDTPTRGGEGRPGHAEPTRAGSRVGPADSGGPAAAPPHGTPAQPARPKGDAPGR